LESTEDGSTWLRRFSSFESDHNRQAKVRDSWLKAFQDLGFSPRFVSSEQIEKGLLDEQRAQVVALPCSWAMSNEEAKTLAQFMARDGVVLCDGTPGLFDEHGKLRDKSPLEVDVAPTASWEQASALWAPAPASPWKGDVALGAKSRLSEKPDAAWLDWVAAHCPITPAFSVQTVPPSDRAAARTRIHRYRLGDVTLLAFERNIDYQMSEDLKQGGGNQRLEKPITLEAKLPAAACVYDLRTKKYLGKADHFTFTLDPWQPALFAVAESEVAVDSLVEKLIADSDR
jgi:hypothetical protein